MDPDALLARIRELVADALPRPLSEALAYDLAIEVQALDEWLMKGGFLPTEWRQQQRISRALEIGALAPDDEAGMRAAVLEEAACTCPEWIKRTPSGHHYSCPARPGGPL